MAIFKRNGKIVVEVATGGKTKNGAIKRTRRVAANMTQAKKLETKLKAERDRGLLIPSANLTVGTFLQQWSDQLDDKVLKARTIESYRQNIRDHINPHIGSIKLANLHQTHVNQMMKTLEENGLGPNSRRITKRVLSTALSYAERNDLVTRNAAKLSEKISVPKRKPLYIQPEQLSDLFISMEGHRFEDLYYLYAHTGIRRGEGLAIKWSDVHMETTPPTVTIQRSWTQIGNHYEITSPKTEDSIRQVPITPELVQRLTKRKEQAVQRQFEPKASDIEDQYVFATIDGNPYRGDAVTKELAKIGNSAGIPNIGPHQLRHLHASMVLGQGIDVAVLSKHLGHTNIGTTVNIYTHQTKNMISNIGDVVNAAISLINSK